ncbi:MAG: alpha/beta hydrolase [Alphaproteobacteria bacterium]|nr:alpha/beta hydrolase [Alphaproteobacteria bacterium]
MSHVIAGDTRIAYSIEGRGPTVVFLHGTAASSSQWAAIRTALAGRCATVALDLHGYGASDPWPGHRRLTLDDEAAAVAAVLRGVDGPVHLVGHSYGGAVALNFALARPGRLSSLTLIEPVSFHLLRDGDAVDQRALHEVRRVAACVAAGMCDDDPARGLEGFVDYWNGRGTWVEIPPARQAALCGMAGTIMQNFEAAIDDPWQIRDCAGLHLPTLLLTGERTTRAARRIGARLAATLPCVISRLVEGAGHMLPRSHPQTVLQAIASHLAPAADGEALACRLSAA